MKTEKQRTIQQNAKYIFTYKQNTANIGYYEKRELESNKRLGKLFN